SRERVVFVDASRRSGRVVRTASMNKLNFLLSAAVATALATTATMACAQERHDGVIVTGERIRASETEVGSRLGLSIRETPAVVDVVTQEDFQIRGVRTAL